MGDSRTRRPPRPAPVVLLVFGSYGRPILLTYVGCLQEVPMRILGAIVCFLCGMCLPALAQEPKEAVMTVRPVHTFSIVARDPETGQMGVAVQSHWFSVGSVVSWAEAGVGAVATQSLVDPSYGPLALDLLK